MTKKDEVLKLLKQGIHTQAELAKETGRSKDTIGNDLRYLIKEGKVVGIGKTSNRYFEPKERLEEGRKLEDASSEMSLGILEDPIINKAKPSEDEWKHHRCQVQGRHTGIPAGIEEQGFIKHTDMENNTYYIKAKQGYELTLYQHALKLDSPQARMPSDKLAALALQRKMEYDAYCALGDMLASYKVTLRKEWGMAGLRVLNFEIARTPSALAKSILMEAKPTYVILAWDLMTGRPRVIADMSKKEELEAILAEFAGQDSDRLKEFVDDLGKLGIEDFWNDMGIDGTREAISEIVNKPRSEWSSWKERAERTERMMETYGQKLNLHLPVLESMKIIEEQQIELNKRQLEILKNLEGVTGRAKEASPTLWQKLKRWLS